MLIYMISQVVGPSVIISALNQQTKSESWKMGSKEWRCRDRDDNQLF